MNCPACGSADSEEFCAASAPDGLVAREYRILRCRSCGLGRTSPAPSAADLAALYGDDYHEAVRARWFDPALAVFKRLFLADRFRLVRSLLKAGPLLDYGCGNGEFAGYARGRGAEAYGVEPNYPSASGFLKPSLAELPPGTGFGLATLWHVFEHLEDPAGDLRAIAAKLAPGGAVFISVPNFAGWEAALGRARWFHLDAPRHRYHYTPESLRLMAEKGGLRLRSLTFAFGFYNVFGMWQTLLNLCGCEMNFLYYSLKRGTDFRRKLGARRWLFNLAAHLFLAPAALAAALPLAALGVLSGRAGVMEAVCEK